MLNEEFYALTRNCLQCLRPYVHELDSLTLVSQSFLDNLEWNSGPSFCLLTTTANKFSSDNGKAAKLY